MVRRAKKAAIPDCTLLEERSAEARPDIRRAKGTNLLFSTDHDWPPGQSEEL